MHYSTTVYNLISSKLGASGLVVCQKLIDHLGLSPIHQRPQAKPTHTGFHGEPKFSVDGAGLLDQFYRSTQDKVHELFHTPEYRTKDDLKKDALQPTAQFINDITSPSLSEFGPDIWNASSTHTTTSCPKSLVYHHLNDREQIVAYVYCWIIARALRKLPSAKPRGTKNNKAEQFKPRPSANILAHRVCPRATASSAPLNPVQRPTSPGEGSSRAVIPPQQPPVTAGPASRKRRNSIAEHDRVAGPMTLRRLGKQPVYSRPIERDSSSADVSYPSPQESSDDDEARCNFPNVSYQYNGLGRAGETFVTHGLPLIAVDLVDVQQYIDEDNDSVIGPANEVQVLQATSQALVELATQRAPGVATPMLATSYRDDPTPVYHARLAAELLKMLESCDPEHQDTATMHTAVMLINRIRTADKERLVRVYGVKFGQYQTMLTMWLEAMDELIKIRTILGFEGDKCERAELLQSLSDEQFESVAKKLCDAIDKVDELRCVDGFTVSKFSEDLTCIFIGLIGWDWMRKTYLERLLKEFNNRLLMWF